VASNQGAPGPDGQSVTLSASALARAPHLLTAALLHGDYKPGEIRRVWIPKASGGVRGLGIPTWSIAWCKRPCGWMLEPLYEPTFHDEQPRVSPWTQLPHGDRRRRGQYLEDGYEWVVDLDLESFFDRVLHQRLMARLAERVSDGRVLGLITSMLRAAW
jgi:RNA-directed DNA polymerase